MRHLLLSAVALLGLLPGGALVADEYLSQDLLEKLVRNIRQKKRIPFPRGQDPKFVKTVSNPELFHGVGRITTREGREIPNVLIQEIWWGNDAGEILVLEIERPVRPFTPEYLLAEEMLAVTVETKNGVIYNFAWNEKQKALVRCRGPIFVGERDANRAEIAWRLAEQREGQKPKKLSRVEVVREYYRTQLGENKTNTVAPR
ncbi:MAG: hypothetical protein NXI22_03805 [bacterium]|nr:hypothetical protein [bacterium]